MSVNFPLLLVLGTLITGLIWLFDIYFLKPKREAAVARAGEIDEEAIEALRKEPVVVEYSISFFPVLAIVLVLRSGEMRWCVRAGFVVKLQYFWIQKPRIESMVWSRCYNTRVDISVLVFSPNKQVFISCVSN